MGDWLPIETAPIEEEFVRVVLVARDFGNRCVMPAIFDGECWRSVTVAGLMTFRNPTHWMPLPEPPEVPAIVDDGETTNAHR